MCGGVSCDEFVNDILAGDKFGLVVLCGLLLLLLLLVLLWFVPILLPIAFGLFNCAKGDAEPTRS